MKLLIVDNYDSFTFNLYQLAAEVFGTLPTVLPNNHDFESVKAGNFDAVIISPGPGTPVKDADFGISKNVIRELDVPILGVCLGHQGICHLAGGAVIHAPVPMHGREYKIFHDGTGLFENVPDPFVAVRYHSLIAAEPLPDCLRKTAWTEDGLVMGIAHKTKPIWGVQFHPESICSQFGRELMENFRRMAAEYWAAMGRNFSVSAPRELSASRAGSSAPPSSAKLRMFVRKFKADYKAEEIFERAFSQQPYAFWLDSSLTREPDARFSFFGGYGAEEVECIRYYAANRRLSIQRGKLRELAADDLFVHLKKTLASAEICSPELPFDFNGGFVGYFGYELKAICGSRRAHRAPHPDCFAMLATHFVALDHTTGEIYLSFIADLAAESAAEAWFEEIQKKLQNPIVDKPLRYEDSDEVVRFSPVHSEREYLDSIDHCFEAIRDGETYEVCLTNQLTATTTVDAFEYYKKLRLRNPAPYSAFLQFPELSVACSSPERFLKINRDAIVETKPIKGTVRRGADPDEDARLKRALAEDEKSRSENLMIVDLLRNDLGRVCSVGSVHVPKLMHVETYATVHQLVTTVCGVLAPEQTAVDCLEAAFPGGSMTGAPKIRTMEIIDELEGRARGIYSGSIGFLSFNGRADLNIVIRTAVFARDKVTIGVGGAVIALSSPEEEWAEILLKAKALLSTFEALGRTVYLMNRPVETYGKAIDFSKRVG